MPDAGTPGPFGIHVNRPGPVLTCNGRQLFGAIRADLDLADPDHGDRTAVRAHPSIAQNLALQPGPARCRYPLVPGCRAEVLMD